MRPIRASSSFVAALVVFTLFAASCGVLGSDDAAPTEDDEIVTESSVSIVDPASEDSTDPAVDEGAAADPPTPSEVPDEDASTDDAIQSPSMGPDEAVACAAVEFGYIRFLRSGSGSDADADLTRGAEEAMALGIGAYEEAGQSLLDVVGTAEAGPAADALLVLCAERGFERLA